MQHNIILYSSLVEKKIIKLFSFCCPNLQVTSELIENENLTTPFPVNSLAVDIENAFLFECAVASILDINGTIDDVIAVNFSEFRGILNQSDDAIVDLAEVVRRWAIQHFFGPLLFIQMKPLIF